MQTMESIIRDAGRRIAALAGEQLKTELTTQLGGAPSTTTTTVTTRRRRRATPATVNLASARTRRIPTWLSQATKLNTKRKLIDRFGPSAVFHKGKPLPSMLTPKQRANLHPQPAAAQ
jgi:hypothetical protein